MTIVHPVVVVILRSTRVVDSGRNVTNVLVTFIPVLELVFCRRLPFTTSSVLVSSSVKELRVTSILRVRYQPHTCAIPVYLFKCRCLHTSPYSQVPLSLKHPQISVVLCPGIVSIRFRFGQNSGTGGGGGAIEYGICGYAIECDICGGPGTIPCTIC